MLTSTQRCAISRRISQGEEDPFVLVDLKDVSFKHKQWDRELPRVRPFYAVKCNPDDRIISTLISKGTGFDCASKREIQTVLRLGASPEDIVFANPCKPPSHIRYAREMGVAQMTFDSADELVKIKQFYPEAQVILRLITDDSQAVCQLSNKYGAELHKVEKLLLVARHLDLSVTGFSFHVGSGCKDEMSFVDALRNCHEAYQIATRLGFEELRVIDIGGGFPGIREDKDIESPAALTFSAIARKLRPALDKYFPSDMGIELIAEPGRFFVHSACVTLANVIGKRVMGERCTADDILDAAIEQERLCNTVVEEGKGGEGETGVSFPISSLISSDSSDSSVYEDDSEDNGDGKGMEEEKVDSPSLSFKSPTPSPRALPKEVMYYINDGLYGSFNCVLYDHQVVTPHPVVLRDGRVVTLEEKVEEEDEEVTTPPPTFISSVWGPTCDGLDCVTMGVALPEMQIGDWLYFPDTGAYTIAAGSGFNGFDAPTIVYLEE